MEKAFQIYLYMCGIIISIIILVGLIGLTLNLIGYAYQSFVGFKNFTKFLKKYNKDMMAERRENSK